MSRLLCRNLVVLYACLSLSGIAYPISASAELVETSDYLSLQEREARIDRVQSALVQDRISAQLAALGVDPGVARQRVASLPDADLQILDERLQELPAGAGALELVVLVFLVMLILDLTGLTDIFPGIGPGKVR